MPNESLHKAKIAKNDEFYTQLSDINNELWNYKEQFKNKVILCNCDDPRVSNFFSYFFSGFHTLGLKKLIATCYKNLNPNLFTQNKDEQAVYCVYDGSDRKDDVVYDLENFIKQNKWETLKGDGDFRSPECIKLLEQADIVVTNPPFSLFREYVIQLIKYDKKFLIIGNKNAITYKEIFKLIKENLLWVGNTPMSYDMLFDIPEEEAKELIANKKEGSGYKIVDGVVKGRAQAIWFTNMDFPKRHEHLVLCNEYNPKEYPKYDNYNAINVDKTSDIPMDYAGVMGVPITFLDKYNPEQFEIIGITEANGSGNSGGIWKGGEKKAFIKGKSVYARIFIRNKKLGAKNEN